MCELWRERKQSLEKAVEEERQLQGRIEKAKAKLCADRKEHEKMVGKLCALEQCLNRETYKCIQDQIHSTDENCLLLPSIPNLEGQNPEGSGLTLVAARARALSLQRERNNLIANARHYRDLAEELQTTNRHLKNLNVHYRRGC